MTPGLQLTVWLLISSQIQNGDSKNYVLFSVVHPIGTKHNAKLIEFLLKVPLDLADTLFLKSVK